MTGGDHAAFRDPPPPLGEVPTAIRARAAAGWRTLLLDERDSLLAAGLVLGDLARMGAIAGLLAATSRVIEDEARHVQVCEHVLSALGAPAEAAPVQREPMPGSVEERLARLLVQGFVVGESMSAAAFASARERATEPLARWAYTELLRDESRHGAFGADAGAWVLARLPAGFAPSLWPACVVEMQEMERRVAGPYDEARLAAEASIPDLDALERLGVIRGSATCRSYRRAIEAWVVPRLRRLGVID